MRPLLFTSLSLATLALAGCGGNAPGANENASGNAAGPVPAGAMTVDPQKIVSAPGNLRMLHGTFAIRAAKPNEPYMNPATVGGACLVARIPVEGKSCRTASDCNITVPGQPETWTGYCLGADNLPTEQGGTCWVKLSDSQNCLKPVGPGEHSTPAMDVSAAYEYVSRTSPSWNRPIDWVLIGCLNGSFAAPPPPCATGNGPYMHRASQVRPVP